MGLIHWLVRKLHRNTRHAPWDDVEVGENRLLLRRDWDRLPDLAPL